MGMKVTGISSTKHRLERIHERTHSRQLKRLVQGGNDITQLAKDNAPRDTGALEQSIKMTKPRTGYHGRIDVFVGVDVSELGLGYSRYGHRYDEYMHDLEYNLGPGSLRKAESGYKVGPQYFQRALDELVDKIAEDMEQIAKEESLG